MPADPPAPDVQQRRSRRRKRRWIAIVIVVALVAGLWFGRNRVVAPALLAAARPWIEDRAGLTLQVDSFAGRWIRGIELRGLRIRPADDGSSPLRAIELERLSVRYRIAELVRNGVAGLDRIEARDGVVELDLGAGAGPRPERPPQWPAAAMVPQIDLRRIDLSIDLGGGTSVSADALSIATDPDPRADAGSSRGDGVAAAAETARLFAGRTGDPGNKETWFEAPAAATFHYAPGEEFPVRMKDVRVRGSTWMRQLAVDPDGWDGDPWISVDLGTGLGRGNLGIGLGPGEAFVRAEAFRMDVGRLRDRFAGVSPLTPDIPAAVGSLSVTGKAEITVPGSTVHDINGEFDLDLRSRSGQAGPLILNNQVDGVQVRGTIADGVVSVTTGTAELASAALTVSDLRIPLPGRSEPYPADRIEGSWQLATRDICDVLIGRTRFRSDIVQRLRPIRLDARGIVRGGRITIDEAVAASRPREAAADLFEIRTATPASIAFLDDASGGLRPPRYEAEIACECADVAAVLPENLAERFGGGLRATISAAGTGATVTGGFGVEIADAAVAPAPPMSLAAAGSWQVSRPERGWGVDLETASLGEADASMALAAPASFGWTGNGGLRIDPSEWAGPPGRVWIEIVAGESATQIAVRGDDLQPRLVAPGVLPAGLTVDGVSGVVTLVVSGGGWSVDVTATAARLVLPGDDADSRAEIAARILPGRIDGAEVRIDRAGNRVVDLAGAFPLPPVGPGAELEGDCRLEGKVVLTDLADLPWLHRLSAWEPSGRVRADINIAGPLGAPRGLIRIAADDLAVGGEIDGKPARFGPATVDGRVLLEDGVRVEMLRLDALAGSAEITGRAGDAQSAPALIREPGIEGLERISVEFDGRLEVDDLGAIPLPRGGFVRRLSGGLEATVHGSGTVGDTTLEGTIALRDGGAGFRAGLAPLTGTEVEVRFDRNHTIAATGTGRIGGAPVATELRLDLSAEPPAIDAKLQGKDVLLTRDVGLRVRGDIDMALHGPIDGALLEGRILLQQSEYTRPIVFLDEINAGHTPSPERLHLFSLSHPLLAGLRFDVEVQASTPVRISNNVLRSRVRPYLTLGGTGRDPTLSGSVWLGPSRVSLPGAALDIESGSIVFDEADSLRPRVDLLGRASLHGYEITAAVSGAFPDPQIDVSSMPPLPREDALLMLLNGQPPARGTGASTTTVVTPALLRYLGSGWFLDRVDQEGRSSSLLDRFEAELGQSAVHGGSETAEYRFRLAPARAFERPTSWHLVTDYDAFGRVNFGLRWGIRYPWHPEAEDPGEEEASP